MSDVAISVEGLGKRYRIGHQQDPYGRLTESLWGALRAPIDLVRRKPREKGEWFWALRDVSFEVREGEVVGVIGRNGSGKSTVLKLLSRITEPTIGAVTLRGRVGSLLEVGTGFHQELTGRENVYMSGAVLGMRRAEIIRRFDEIVDFAGIGQFLDTPVKRYSSGMQVRLGFAVAAHLESDILIVDEVLAVGDAAFQKKCVGKMGDVSKEGRTVVFVSHDMAAITRLCPKALLLDSGICVFQGNTDGAVDRYLQTAATTIRSHVDLREAAGGDGARTVILTWISTQRLDGTETSDFRTGGGIVFRIGYHVDGHIEAYVQIVISNNLGERLITLRSTHDGPPLDASGDGVIQCRVRDNRLISGEYTVLVEIGRELPEIEPLDWVPEATQFRVKLGDYLSGSDLVRGHGVMAQRSEWSVIPGDSYRPELT